MAEPVQAQGVNEEVEFVAGAVVDAEGGAEGGVEVGVQFVEGAGGCDREVGGVVGV